MNYRFRLARGNGQRDLYLTSGRGLGGAKVGSLWFSPKKGVYLGYNFVSGQMVWGDLVRDCRRRLEESVIEALNPVPALDLVAFLERQGNWSEKTFGPGRRTKGILRHIVKEIREVRRNPEDLVEWLDIAFLAFDGARRAGYSPTEICIAFQKKQVIIFSRKYPMTPEDEPSEHVREDVAVAS